MLNHKHLSSYNNCLQIALYAYYVATAAGLRAMSPALALMTSQEAHLSGAYRSAHQVWDRFVCRAAPV